MMIGKTILHYKNLKKLGAGGMGEVYRAEDTNLSRQVAIKVLPEFFAKDLERLARFERACSADSCSPTSLRLFLSSSPAPGWPGKMPQSQNATLHYELVPALE
jgi:serine/threonine protein kinase